MRSSTILASLAVVASASAQTVTPIALLGYLEQLLSPTCQSTLTTLLSSNSSLSQCVHTSGLLPILENTNTSIIPNINTYLTGLCAAPACTNTTITNATSQILAGCSSDLSNFGISNTTVNYVFGAYSTIREVACLSSNSSVSSMYANSTNSTNSSSILCPISLLYDLQSYIGQPLTNSYIDTLILGGNATAYNQLLSITNDTTLLEQVACGDCFAGSVDVILENYPVLGNSTFNLPAGAMGYLNGTNITIPAGMMNFTVPQLYQGVCNITVGSNVSLPSTINETAYNTTLPYNSTATGLNITLPVPHPFQPLNMTTRSEKAREEAKKRFGRWN